MPPTRPKMLQRRFRNASRGFQDVPRCPLHVTRRLQNPPDPDFGRPWTWICTILKGIYETSRDEFWSVFADRSPRKRPREPEGDNRKTGLSKSFWQCSRAEMIIRVLYRCQQQDWLGCRCRHQDRLGCSGIVASGLALRNLAWIKSLCPFRFK